MKKGFRFKLFLMATDAVEWVAQKFRKFKAHVRKENEKYRLRDVWRKDPK